MVRFKVIGEDAYFLAWTTTPWTLPSNVALCVNPDENYCKVKAADGYTYYMAEALLDKVLGGMAGSFQGRRRLQREHLLMKFSRPIRVRI